MMKILAINGSYRGENGLTHILISKLFEGAIHAGATCETIILAKKKINICKGCRICQTEKSYLKCIYHDKDDVAEIINKIAESDIIIYATPIYIFSMSGILKIFLERILASTADSSIRKLSESGLLFHHINTQIASKPFVVITCQDNFENATYQNVVDFFTVFSNFLDAPIVGMLNRKSALFMEYKHSDSDQIKNRKVKEVYSAYYQAGEEIIKSGKILKKTQKIANQNILPIPKTIEFILKLKLFRKNKAFMKKILEKART